jgi:hypothetical protein
MSDFVQGHGPESSHDREPQSKEELLRKLEESRAEVARLEAEVAQLHRESGPRPDGGRRGPSASHNIDIVADDADGNVLAIEVKSYAQRSHRELVLDALADLGCVAYTRELVQYCAAAYGWEIAPTRFSALVNDESKSFHRKRPLARPVWLCVAVTSNRHLPIKRLLGRSDWPLKDRIIAPTTGRIQHLKITRRLCEVAMKADQQTTANPEMLRIIAADHARDLPGVRFRRGQFDLEVWRATADRILAELEPADEAAKVESAARLARHREYEQLFGLPGVIEGDEPPGRERRDSV